MLKTISVRCSYSLMNIVFHTNCVCELDGNGRKAFNPSEQWVVARLNHNLGL